MMLAVHDQPVAGVKEDLVERLAGAMAAGCVSEQLIRPYAALT
jgi:hypothetical protein